MSIAEWEYTFVTEDGTQKLKYKDYLKTPELVAKIQDKRRETLILGKYIVSFPRAYLRANADKSELFTELKRDFDNCPMRYFSPSGQTVIDFINDDEHTISGIQSGNRGGKTTSAWIKVLTRAIPCDKDWEIFNTGIEWREWEGPKVIGVASYEFVNHKTTIWPQVLRKWTPKHELGPWAVGGKKNVNWRDNPHIEMPCGSSVYFFAYSQDQGVFESQAVDIWLWDEQGEEPKFIGANERTRTRDGIHIFSLTPHKLEGRPDTGGGSWIHKFTENEESMGHKIKFFQFNLIEDVPDWVYPEKQKLSAIEEWVNEPLRTNNLKKIREGRSRLFGDWHESSGLVYDEWDSTVHVIDPFEIPKTWTRYRSIDFGTRSPTACLYAAVNPEGDVFLYDEYYETARTIFENVKGMVEKGGNKLIPIKSEQMKNSGLFFDRYYEDKVGAKFYKTLFDPRSFATPEPLLGCTISQAFINYGIVVIPASGKEGSESIPIVKDWFRIDPSRKHFITKQMGAPRIYVFSKLNNFIREIQHYVNEERRKDGGKNPSERPRHKDDHLMDALRYLIQAPPIYIDGYNEIKESSPMDLRNRSMRVDRYSAY